MDTSTLGAFLPVALIGVTVGLVSAGATALLLHVKAARQNKVEQAALEAARLEAATCELALARLTKRLSQSRLSAEESGLFKNMVARKAQLDELLTPGVAA